MQRLVHLDLKGAPPKLTYIEQLLPLLKRWSITGVLVEYEDTFPYTGDLADVVAQTHYSEEEVRYLVHLAEENGLIVIPLIQSIGHLEFVLKLKKFSNLREVYNYPNSLCPSRAESVDLICRMVGQVLAAHPSSTHIHLGADEVYHVGICPECVARMARENITPHHLYLKHMELLVRFIREHFPHISVIIWDDMLRSISQSLLQEFTKVCMVEPMVWCYETAPLPSEILNKYSASFPHIWIASAFKGATGSCRVVTDISYHVDNQLMWLSVIGKEKHRDRICGVAFTGWQRYDHYSVLCELLPQAIPSLGFCVAVFLAGHYSKGVALSVTADLGFDGPIPMNTQCLSTPPNCTFPGSRVYRAVFLFAELNNEYQAFITSERLETWMNPYNIQRQHTNPLHVEYILYAARTLCGRFLSMRDEMLECLNEVYASNTVHEFMDTFIAPKIHKLENIITQAENQIQLWTNRETTTTERQPMAATD